MKKILSFLLITLFLYSCGSTGEKKKQEQEKEVSNQNGSDSTNSIKGNGDSTSYYTRREEARQNNRYHILVDELLKGNIQGYNFKQLRLEYTVTTYYNPYEIKKSILKMKELYKQERYGDIAEIVKQNINVQSAEIDFHLYAMLAYKKLGEDNLSKFHAFVMRSLIESINESGDGSSFDTAYTVISANEEFSFLTYFEYERISQEFIEDEIHTYDVFSVKKEGRTHTIYFNVDIPVKWLNAQPR